MSHNIPKLCFYFQVHQPYRLRDLRMTEMEVPGVQYFDVEKNAQIFRKVSEKCYLPANKLMLTLLKRHPGMKIAYSLSGAFLDQCEEYGPDVLKSFQDLVATGQVEILAETFYHSLSSVHSVKEFNEQVHMHTQRVRDVFGVTPKTFRNTELIYTNEIAQMARTMGFTGILAEGADFVLKGRSPNVPYNPPAFELPTETQEVLEVERFLPEADSIKVLLKNYRLSDDVAFRFSDKSWVGFPLTADRFAEWLANTGGESVNLFMDYETFGEHQWEDTGIFRFLEALPKAWEDRGGTFATPSEVIEQHGNAHTDTLDVHAPMSWADIERDLSAWKGNRIQDSALKSIFALEDIVKNTQDKELLSDWRKLTTSDHFYYMCTKFWSDGDVHKYFSPYESPYEAFRRFSHAVHDVKHRAEKIKITREESDDSEESEVSKQKSLLGFFGFLGSLRLLPKSKN